MDLLPHFKPSIQPFTQANEVLLLRRSARLAENTFEDVLKQSSDSIGANVLKSSDSCVTAYQGERSVSSFAVKNKNESIIATVHSFNAESQFSPSWSEKQALYSVVVHLLKGQQGRLLAYQLAKNLSANGDKVLVTGETPDGSSISKNFTNDAVYDRIISRFKRKIDSQKISEREEVQLASRFNDVTRLLMKNKEKAMDLMRQVDKQTNSINVATNDLNNSTVDDRFNQSNSRGSKQKFNANPSEATSKPHVATDTSTARVKRPPPVQPSATSGESFYTFPNRTFDEPSSSSDRQRGFRSTADDELDQIIEGITKLKEHN